MKISGSNSILERRDLMIKLRQKISSLVFQLPCSEFSYRQQLKYMLPLYIIIFSELKVEILILRYTIQVYKVTTNGKTTLH